MDEIDVELAKRVAGDRCRRLPERDLDVAETGGAAVDAHVEEGVMGGIVGVDPAAIHLDTDGIQGEGLEDGGAALSAASGERGLFVPGLSLIHI